MNVVGLNGDALLEKAGLKLISLKQKVVQRFLTPGHLNIHLKNAKQSGKNSA